MNKKIKQLVFKGVGVAMGISTLVLQILDKITIRNSFILLSIGLIAISISLLDDENGC